MSQLQSTISAKEMESACQAIEKAILMLNSSQVQATLRENPKLAPSLAAESLPAVSGVQGYDAAYQVGIASAFIYNSVGSNQPIEYAGGRISLKSTNWGVGLGVGVSFLKPCFRCTTCKPVAVIN